MLDPPKGWNYRVPFTEAKPGHLYRLLMVATRSPELGLGDRVCFDSHNVSIPLLIYKNKPDTPCVFISMNRAAYYATLLVGEQLIRVAVGEFSHQSTGIREWLEEYQETEE